MFPSKAGHRFVPFIFPLQSPPPTSNMTSFTDEEPELSRIRNMSFSASTLTSSTNNSTLRMSPSLSEDGSTSISPFSPSSIGTCTSPFSPTNMSISSCISPSSKLEADTTAEIHDNMPLPKPKTVQIFWFDNRSGEDKTTLKLLRYQIINIFGRGNYVFETILPVGNGERRGINDLDVKDISKSGCIVVANGNNSGEETLSPALEKFILKHPFATVIAVSANSDRIINFNARFKQLQATLAAVYPITSPSLTTTQDAPLTPCYHHALIKGVSVAKVMKTFLQEFNALD